MVDRVRSQFRAELRGIENSMTIIDYRSTEAIHTPTYLHRGVAAALVENAGSNLADTQGSILAEGSRPIGNRWVCNGTAPSGLVELKV